MLKIVLVDDEPLTLLHLQKMLKSYDLPINICGTATNTKEALNIIKKTHPNLIITDIRMGSSNGLDLCEKLKTIMPYIKIIIISGYNDFEYAKRAIKYNVKDYILKPINHDELYKRICKLNEVIQQDEDQQENNLKLRQQIIDCLPMLNDWFLKMIKNYSYDTTKLAETLKLFNINILGNFYQIIYIEIDNYSNAIFENDINEMASFSKALSTLIVQNVKFVYFYDSQSIWFIISSNQNAASLSEITYKISDRFLQYLEYNCHSNFSIGISTVFEKLAMISNHVKDAKIASSYSFYIGYNKIISINDVEETNKTSLSYNFSKIQEDIFMHIKMCDNQESMNSLDLFLNSLLSMKANISFTKNKFIELYFYIFNAIEQEFGTLKNSANDLYTFLIKSKNIMQIRQIFYLYINQVIQDIDELRQDKSSKFILKTKQYINKHLSDNIPLENIAYEVGLSACYLSTLFKNLEQVSIKEYIINIRIEKAKELLKDQSIKIYEIALQVGYSDSRYFSQLFKKVTGYTPCKYREFLLSN